MMEKLSTGLTWNQVQKLFEKDNQYNMSLEFRPRRANNSLRKRGLTSQRKVWRLIIQQDYKNYVKTILRCNIKDEDEKLKTKKAYRQTGCQT